MTDNLPSTVHSVGFSFNELQRIAESMARSQLFGIRTPDQALTLMLISQAEGRHPALAARDYDIIQGRPTKKAEAMQRDFLSSGGQITWLSLSDTDAKAKFSHPQGGTATIEWDMKRAAQAGLVVKEMWKKFPRQMLRSRVISEGVRTIYPGATSGMYVPEEAQDFASHEPIDVTPPKTEEVVSQVDQWRAERDGTVPQKEYPEFEPVGLDRAKLIAQGNSICHDIDVLKLFWNDRLTREQRVFLGAGKGQDRGPVMAAWSKGQKFVEQASPLAPLAAEQPADDGSPKPASPQAEIPEEDAFDAFGLPTLPQKAESNDDDVACTGILQLVSACLTQDEIFQVEKAYEARMNRLPEAKWRDLVAAIGKHKSAIFEAQK